MDIRKKASSYYLCKCDFSKVTKYMTCSPVLDIDILNIFEYIQMHYHSKD